MTRNLGLEEERHGVVLVGRDALLYCRLGGGGKLPSERNAANVMMLMTMKNDAGRELSSWLCTGSKDIGTATLRLSSTDLRR
jgi:hypothetical protein